MMKYWLYHFIRILRHLPIRMFFKRVLVDGAEGIPKTDPILFVSNHSASFLDGGIIAFYSGREVFSLTRGDVFRQPKYNRLLRAMRLLPIFRSRDADLSTAKNGNERTFEACYEIFKEQGSVTLANIVH